jgi:flavin reductase (DIM6/NTAB) family NADH-FMN oxidoreductase RutF
MSQEDAARQMAATLGRIPSGLFVVTARQGALETGMLASWVQQCSFEPPQLSMAVKQGREVLGWLTEGAAFIVNLLDDSQTDMIAHFGRGFRPGDTAFHGLEIKHPEADGPAVLADALGYLVCRVTGRFAAGDHDLVIGYIVGGRILNDGHPMVHIRKSGMHY